MFDEQPTIGGAGVARCLHDGELAAYLEAGASPDERKHAEEHFAACATCREHLAELARLEQSDAFDHRSMSLDIAERAPSSEEVRVAPGAILGRYVLFGRLGSGGMGEVHTAYDPELDRRVAIKVIRPHTHIDDAKHADRRARAMARLLREARAYMAPEQWLGRAVDARSDQFAFAVVAYEGLFGTRPFSGRDQNTLRANVISGRLNPPPRTASRRLRRILGRALAVDPTQRYPDMLTLLAELTPRTARQARLVAGLGVGAFVASIALISQPGKAACADAEARLHEIWDNRQSDVISAALVKAESPYADQAAHHAVTTIDDWTRRWLSTYRDVCEAQPGGAEALLSDARAVCLDGALRTLSASVDLLAQGGADVTEHANAVVDELPAPEPCARRVPNQELVDPSPPVADALARARASRAVGRFREALALANEARALAAAEADTLGQTEATLLVGESQIDLGDDVAADSSLVEAIFAAQRHRQTTVQARGALMLARLLALNVPRWEEAARWCDYAQVELERIGPESELWPGLHRVRALIERHRRGPEASLAELDRAEAWFAKYGNDKLEKSQTLADRATTLRAAGRYAEAVTSASEAVQLFEEVLGPAHPDITRVLASLAMSFNETLQPALAKETILRAIAVGEAHDHADVATNLRVLGLIHWRMGEYADGVSAGRRALQLSIAKHGEISLDAAGDHELLAVVSVNEPDRGESHAETAVKIREQLQPGHPKLAESYQLLATFAATTGRTEQAEQLLRRALSIIESIRPVNSLKVGAVHLNLAVNLELQGRFAEARELFMSADALFQPSEAGTDPRRVRVLLGIGASSLGLGDAETAVVYLERAEQVLLGTGSDPILLGEIQFALGRALATSGRDRALAVAKVAEAAATFSGAGPAAEGNLAEAREWLRAHQ